MTTLIYEIADVTSDEIYFTLAVYADLETAKIKLFERLDKDCAITDSADYDDYEKIEIREKQVGWGERYKIVVELERRKIYSEAYDTYEWQTTIKQMNQEAMQ